ncbi:MAG: branched-chain amino acid ABC transporter permease [Propionibacteriaceae bacterium]|jgi:branched-chain amino acid transport system permease protein|nr:branched-chain amino acid ABC transporter permease [Propionibacteriaceae bacterium]
MTQVLIDGLFLGCVYALIALGYSMVYGIIKLLNFAHGDIFMFGAMIAFTMLTAVPGLQSAGIVAVFGVLILSMFLTGGTGVLIEAVAYKPLRSAPRLSLLITAVGMSFVLEYGVKQFWGSKSITWPQWAQMGAGSIPIFDGTITISRLVLMAVSIALMVGLGFYINGTRQGRAMRAIALDQRASTLMGVDVNRTISLVFFIGSALAGAAGVMFGMYYGAIGFMMGFLLGLKAFTAAVIGGIGNMYGAMLGGLTLGLIERTTVYFCNGDDSWKDVVSFGLLILFLTLRPTGILGDRVVERM